MESKDNKPVPKPEEVNPNDPEVLDIFRKVIDQHIPVSDFLNFVFLLEGISVSFREQMVRHRVGVKFGPRVGVDVVPDIGNSSWWGQSMRILDMGKFYADGYYREAEIIKQNPEAHEVFNSTLLQIEEAYRKMLSLGIPIEDARDVIPLGACHRFSWQLNLTALKHVIGKRGCWIPQLGLWKPIIYGMINELATKVHPHFNTLIAPPCVSGDKFNECVYKYENERRIKGEDETVPCPLYLQHHSTSEIRRDLPKILGEKRTERFNTMIPEYTELWKHNPWTWEPMIWR